MILPNVLLFQTLIFLFQDPIQIVPTYNIYYTDQEQMEIKKGEQGNKNNLAGNFNFTIYTILRDSECACNSILHTFDTILE